VPSACIICLRPRPDGGEGLLVRGCFICPECEARIVSLSADDPDYGRYRQSLKEIWRRPG